MPVAPRPTFSPEPQPEGSKPGESLPFSKEKKVEKSEPAPPQGPAILSHLNTFFGWLGELINEQARAEAQAENVPPLAFSHDISIRKRQEEVLVGAQEICEDLEELKQRLTLEFGGSASSFIVKSIDPMIEHAKHLIADLTDSERHSENFQDLLEQAIDSVDLYAQFSDETKLKRKIVHEAHQAIKQSIEKDIDVLGNYKLQAVSNLSISMEEKKTREVQLDRFLYPIRAELKGMAEAYLETDDLHAFFVWKTQVDDRRGALVELGLLTIDALTGPLGEQNGEFTEEEERDLASLEQDPVDSVGLSVLATLEDRASNFLDLLEQVALRDLDSLRLIEQLLTDLKMDVQRHATGSSQSPKVQEDFHQLDENIKKAEQLLHQKKKSLKIDTVNNHGHMV